MQILLIMLIVVLLAFSVLLLALAKQSPREKQTEDKEQEEYIRDYAETVRQTGGSMKKLEHWKVIAIYLIIYDMIAVNFSYFMALLVRFDFRYSSIPTDYFVAWRSFAPIYTIIILAVFGCMHLYNSVWRFASFHELIKITVATVITGVLHIVGITIFWGRMPASYYLIGIMLQFFLTVGVRFSYRFVLLERNRREKSERAERSKNVMIIGAGEAGRTIVRELQNAKETNSRVRCLIDDNPNKWGRYMEGVPVVGGRDDIFLNVDKYHINQILLAIPTATPHQKRDILNICKETGCELKQLPGVYQLVNGEVSLSKMKKVAVEDLLGRDTIKVNMSEIFQYLKGKRILVTGGGGSIGSELCRQIAGHEPELLVIFDIYENNAYDIEQELKASYPNLNLKVLIGSVRDSKRINWVFETYKPEIVYHAAAHKHVPLMENSPCEAIKNNVVGTYKTASHTEIKITKDGPKVVELGARLGGDNITTYLTPLSTGVDMVESCIRIALDETADLEPKFYKASAIRYFRVEQGVIRDIRGLEEARKIPGVKQIYVVHGIGEKMNGIKSSGDRSGFVIAQADTAEVAVEICEKALDLIEIEME